MAVWTGLENSEYREGPPWRRVDWFSLGVIVVAFVVMTLVAWASS